MNCNNEQLNFTCGGDQQLFVTLRREGQAFPAELSDDVVLNIVSDRAERINVSFQLGDEGRLIATLPGEQFRRPGSYGVEVVGTLNGAKWRAWRKRCIRYTPDTQPAATRSTAQQADPYDITIDVGLVQDIIPRRTSELVNDGEDGNDPFAKAGDVAEALKRYAPLNSPTFTGYPRYDDTSQSPSGYYKSIYLASKSWVYRFIEWLKQHADGIASLVNGKVPISQLPTDGNDGLVQRSLLGAAKGVATLDANRLVWDDQLRLGWRGYFTGDLDATNTKPGIYGIDDRPLSPDILGGEKAHGIFIQMPDVDPRNYRTQILVVGRNAQSANGDATETYTRRYLPGKSGWGAWGRSDRPRYTLQKSGSNIQLLFDGKVVATVADSNTTYAAMSQAEAEAGTASAARTITAQRLKQAIEKHTEGKATIDFVNSSVQTATAEFKGTHNSLEELQAVEGADQNDYGYVVETDAAGNKVVRRYKYVEGAGWQWEYDLNTTGFTAEEWQAVKSGINPELVQKLRSLPEPDATMPLTRMTDTMLNPDECLNPGVYENVQFPTVDTSIDIPEPVYPEYTAAYILDSSVTNRCTLYTSRLGKRKENGKYCDEILLQVAIGIDLHYGRGASQMGGGNYVLQHLSCAKMAVRVVKKVREIESEVVEIDPSNPNPITPEPKYYYQKEPWFPMASFLDIKKAVERIKASFTLKQSTAVYTADSTAADFRPMELGTVADGGKTYTLYRFLYRTEALPANSSMEIDLSALMGDYAVKEWTSADGFVDSHKMSSGRTDNLNNVCIIQQLTKSTKKLYLRTYADLSAKTALLQLEFYGEKAIPIG